MTNPKPIRNYPFRGKIYTAKQIDEILNGTVLTDYYTKTEIDTILDDKQDKLTAGDNITISDENVISASSPPTLTAGVGVVIGSDNKINVSNDWEKITGLTNSQIIQYIKDNYADYEFLFQFRKHGTILSYPSDYDFTNNYDGISFFVPCDKNHVPYIISMYSSGTIAGYTIGGESSQLINLSSITIKDGSTVIDSTNCDTYFSSVALSDLDVVYNNYGNVKNFSIKANDSYVAFINEYGSIYYIRITELVKYIKNTSGAPTKFNSGASMYYTGQFTVNNSDISFYRRKKFNYTTN